MALETMKQMIASTILENLCGDKALRIAPDQTYFLQQPMVIAILKMASFG